MGDGEQIIHIERIHVQFGCLTRGTNGAAAGVNDGSGMTTSPGPGRRCDGRFSWYTSSMRSSRSCWRPTYCGPAYTAFITFRLSIIAAGKFIFAELLMFSSLLRLVYHSLTPIRNRVELLGLVLDANCCVCVCACVCVLPFLLL